ncbi:MAG: glycosyltransferase, partial [Planctomycetota bacterium]|nr:glycosyltransferase [Planctomycetota bacterium]
MGDAAQRILFSGGGTVGHLAPGFALADALNARGVETHFATPGEDVERAWFEGRTAPLTLPALRRPRGAGELLGFPIRFFHAIRAARGLMKAQGIGALVALGGWPCAPAALAARGARVPLAFLVPDAVPGLVVRRF